MNAYIIIEKKKDGQLTKLWIPFKIMKNVEQQNQECYVIQANY